MLPGVITPLPTKVKLSRVPCPVVRVLEAALKDEMEAAAPTVTVTVSVVVRPAGLVTVSV